jgi:hypothetical protein
MELTTSEPQLNPIQGQCVYFALLGVRALVTTVWALDDGHSDPRLIEREALALIQQHGRTKLHSRLAQRSPRVADEVCSDLVQVAKLARQLQAVAINPSTAGWWKHTRVHPDFAFLQDLQIDKVPSSDDPDELRGEATAYVEKQFRRRLKTAVGHLNFQVRFLCTRFSGKRWEWWPEHLHTLIRSLLIEAFFLTSGFDAAQIARNSHRNIFDKSGAKKRGGTGARHARRIDSEVARATKVELDDELPAASGHTPEEQVLSRQVATHYMDKATKLWGESGTRMIKALAGGATRDEAAEEAGVSESTFRRRLAELRK